MAGSSTFHHAMNDGMSPIAPMTRPYGFHCPLCGDPQRSRGSPNSIQRVPPAPPLRRGPNPLRYAGSCLTAWTNRYRRQSSVPSHMLAKKCGFRPAFTVFGTHAPNASPIGRFHGFAAGVPSRLTKIGDSVVSIRCDRSGSFRIPLHKPCRSWGKLQLGWRVPR